MAYQAVNTGTSEDYGDGDTLRAGATKINANFVELYTALGTGTALTSGISADASVVTLTAPVIAEIDSGSTITLDATTDIILDAGGDDIFFKADGTTFGSANNNSGNLIIKSGTTTALTFSGANVTAAGTIASGAIVSSGTVTATDFIIGSASINEAQFEVLDDVSAGTVTASKAVVVDSNKDIGTFRNLTIDGVFTDGNYTFDTSGNVTGLGTIASGAITSTGVVTGTGFTIGSAVIAEAELEMIDGITAGTAAASKALVLDGSTNIAGIGTISSGAITSSGVVTGTGFTIGSAVIAEAELEMLDGITAGTAAGSKAVVLDANKDIGTFRNLTIDGVFTDGNYTFDTSGNVTGLGTIASGAITSTGVVTGTGFTAGSAVIAEAELEMIDGITAGTAAASKALVLDASTNISGIGTISSGAITSSGNITSGDRFIIGSANITEAELEMLDGITAGTAAGSKAVVLDANKDIGTIRNLTIDGVFTDGNYTFDTSGNVSGLGTVGSGAITSSGAITAGSSFIIGSADINETDLEKLDGITDGTAAANKAVVADGSTAVSGLTLTAPTIAEIDSGSTITLDATTDIVLDADGGDIFFKDGGVTFGSATNTSGNLIVKSGTTTALTFSGANVTAAGTVASGAITSSGLVTAGSLNLGDDSVSTLKSGTYTPSWAASTGDAPAIGNGSLTGRYTQIGNLCHALIKVYFGSSSTYGNGGVLRFGLPFTAATISGMAHVGSGSYIIDDTGTGTTGGTVELGSGLAYVTLNCNPAGTVGTSLATNAVPHTWANGDSLTIDCTFEV